MVSFLIDFAFVLPKEEEENKNGESLIHVYQRSHGYQARGAPARVWRPGRPAWSCGPTGGAVGPVGTSKNSSSEGVTTQILIFETAF